MIVSHSYDVGLKGFVAIPEFLRSTNYRNPVDSNNGPWQLGHGLSNKSVFEWLADNPKENNSMQTFFEADRGSRPDWVDWFPVEEKLLGDEDFAEDDVVLVDVAGGRGHDLDAFLKKFPDLKGRFVLHDLPLIISDETLALNPRIEKKSFDFWVDQPVAGILTTNFKKFRLISHQGRVYII